MENNTAVNQVLEIGSAAVPPAASPALPPTLTCRRSIVHYSLGDDDEVCFTWSSLLAEIASFSLRFFPVNW